MELEIYSQVAILLTTLFSGSDTRPAASRQTSIIRLQSVEYPRSSQVQKLQYRLSRQGALNKRPLAVENVLKSSIERRAVMHRLDRTGKLRKEFFQFPSKNGRIVQKRKTVTQKTIDYLANVSQQKAAAKSSMVRSGKVRRRRYLLQGSKWPVIPGRVSTITWNVAAWSTKLSIGDTNKTLAEAFRMWAEVSPLIFRWVDSTSAANIAIMFAIGDHGDTQPFDGSGGLFAHAKFPQYGGSIHFDDAESWTTNYISGNSKSLLAAAVHEIGHSLGLKHSTVSGSVMSAHFSLQTSNVVLADDDVNGIKAIYGRCQPKVTAIESSMNDGRTYSFNADHYWRLNDAKHESDRGYPSKIHTKWQGITDNIDDIFLWGHNWRTYIFKGSWYYKYKIFGDNTLGPLEPNYPKRISQGWPGVPDDIDAAFTGIHGDSYFFKGDQVYKFDNGIDQVANGFPVSINQVFAGVPNNIDSAFRWYYDGYVYFFKDEYYWKMDYSGNIAGSFLIGIDGWKNLCDV